MSKALPTPLFSVTIQRYPIEERPVKVGTVASREEILAGIGMDVVFGDLDRVEEAADPHDPFPE